MAQRLGLLLFVRKSKSTRLSSSISQSTSTGKVLLLVKLLATEVSLHLSRFAILSLLMGSRTATAMLKYLTNAASLTRASTQATHSCKVQITT